VGFYLGTDGQVHGFMANQGSAVGGMLTGTPIADPTIPPDAGEPGATFVFSQVLGINDEGIAVGYYGDSTTSQHGFLYDTHTGNHLAPGIPRVRGLFRLVNSGGSVVDLGHLIGGRVRFGCRID
jgi:hypothetical protein